MDEACPKCGADDGIAGKCAAMFVAQKAEIASLRAQIAEVRRDAGESVVLLGGERDYLRAELTANNELYSITQSDLAAVSLQYDAAMAVIERLEATARQDAEEIARLKEDRTTELRNEFEGIRSELETTKRQSFVEGLNEAQRQYYPRVERLEATARHDAEEKARLQRCLNFFASVIKSGESWTETCEREYRAALACHPQPEVHIPSHGPFPGAPFSPKVERS